MAENAVIQWEGCDKCGPTIKAYFYFQMLAGPLTFCGSCGTRYEGAILEQGGHVTHDLRYLITA